MKIGIDIRCLAEGKRTGVDEYTRKTLAWLFETHPSVSFVLFFNAWKKKERDFSWATRYPNVQLRVYAFPNKLLNFCLWYLQYPKLDRLIGGVEAYFVPNINFVAVSKKCRLVVTAHDLSFEYYPQAFSWKQRFWHYLINFRGLLKRADAIIAVSHSTKADVEATYGVPAHKITVIHSGVDMDFHPLSRNTEALYLVQKKYQLPYKFILSLGTFEPRKNTVALVQAFEAFCRISPELSKEFHLVLAGAYGWKSRELKQAVIQSSVREKIHCLGYVEPEDKPALYNLAQVFVYPSFDEGFGFPPLEAMACGVPVITSNVASLPEVVGGAGILIDPYCPDDIVDALRAVLEDSLYREGLVKKGLAKAGMFPWRETAQKTYQVLVGNVV